MLSAIRSFHPARWAALVMLGGALLVGQPTDSLAAANGVLHATGDGFGNLGIQGSATVSGKGVVWIKDVKGDAVINVTGYDAKRTFDDGWTEYVGFNGTASVAGSGFHLALGLYDATLDTSGHGRVQLRGEGACTLNGHACGWERDPTSTKAMKL